VNPKRCTQPDAAHADIIGLKRHGGNGGGQKIQARWSFTAECLVALVYLHISSESKEYVFNEANHIVEMIRSIGRVGVGNCLYLCLLWIVVQEHLN